MEGMWLPYIFAVDFYRVLAIMKGAKVPLAQLDRASVF